MILYNYASTKVISIILLKMLSKFIKIRDLKFFKRSRKSIILHLDLKNYNTANDGYRIQSSINAKKKIIQNNNGPNLKDFITKANIKNNYSSNDEIVSNKIFLEHINNLNLNDHEFDQSADSFYKRKVFFEVHGCQMNVNDTGIF